MAKQKGIQIARIHRGYVFYKTWMATYLGKKVVLSGERTVKDDNLSLLKGSTCSFIRWVMKEFSATFKGDSFIKSKSTLAAVEATALPLED